MPLTRLTASATQRTGSLWTSEQTWRQVVSRMAGSRQRRFPRLHLSPNRILALRMRSKTDQQKKGYAKAFRLAAYQRNERLPTLTLQMWLKKQDISSEGDLSKYTSAMKPTEWRDLFDSLATRGWSEQHLEHWIWILSGENGDVRVQRFISTDEQKPIFMLLLLVRSDEIFRHAASIFSLMEYIVKHYLAPKPGYPEVENQKSTVASKTILAVPQFLILIRRLVLHVQRLMPRSIVTVSRFIANYIRELATDRRLDDSPHSVYRFQCMVFNTALLLFKRPAATQPVANMEFNWRAQKILLTMSDSLEKPLVINKTSYRAIRQVMVGLKRSTAENAVALRYTKTWPPYRQDFDGLDAKRTPDDDHSRSIKAGNMMREAGYAEHDYDRALDALGGMGHLSPTVQTRSLPPKEWKDGKEKWNFYSLWAMNVRATRNPQEAWRAFNDFAAKTGEAPNIQVYGEMFLKLQARGLDPDSAPLAGDARENLPVHDANYSEYELARLSPPTVSELYSQMISRGVKPEGHSLYRLVSNARSVEEGLRYLRDSGLDASDVNALALFKQPSYQALRRIPLRAFSSYIQLLCRLQPDRRGREKIPSDELYRIRHAIKLVKLRLIPATTEGATFLPPWHTIFRALARPYISLRTGTQAENDVEALTISMDLSQSAQKTIGIDAENFNYLCRTVQKAAVSQLDKFEGRLSPAILAGEEHLVVSRREVLQRLKAMFSKLTTPVGMDASALAVPKFQYSLGPAHLHAYMRTLAFLGDSDGMIDLVSWILQHSKYVEDEAELLGHRGDVLIAKTLCAFQAFAGSYLDEEQIETLMDGMGRISKEEESSWRWPTAEEVDNYIESDLRGGSQKLQKLLLARWWQGSSQQENEARETTGAAAA